MKTFTEKEKKEIREVIKSGIILFGNRVEIRNTKSFKMRIGAKPEEEPFEIHSSRVVSIRWADSNSKQITVRLSNYTELYDKYEYELPIEQFKKVIRDLKLQKLGL